MFFLLVSPARSSACWRTATGTYSRHAPTMPMSECVFRWERNAVRNQIPFQEFAEAVTARSIYVDCVRRRDRTELDRARKSAVYFYNAACACSRPREEMTWLAKRPRARKAFLRHVVLQRGEQFEPHVYVTREPSRKRKL